MEFKNFPERIRVLGGLLGYPECCIESMATHYEKNPDSNGYALYMESLYGTNPFHGLGFVPCESCYTNKKEDMIQAINKKRHPSIQPFPYSNFKTLCDVVSEVHNTK